MKLSKGELLIHLGFPKCFSTSLQRGFYPKHSEINYLGINSDLTYSNADVELINENLLIYANEQTFNQFFLTCKNSFHSNIDSGKVNVLSNEFLSLRLSVDQIFTQHKIQRLYKLVEGLDTKILIFIREPISLIKSLYKEFVKIGYRKSYDDFIIWLWTFRDRNFLYDLDYNQLIKNLTDYFDEDKISYYRFEDFTENFSHSINSMFSSFGLSDEKIKIENHNKSLSPKEIRALLDSSTIKNYGLGNQSFTNFEFHRNREWFRRSKSFLSEDLIYSDVLLKRKAIEQSILNHDDKVSNRDIFNLSQSGLHCLDNIKSILSDD